MQFGKEDVLQAQLISAVNSKGAPSSWLILAAGESAFFNASDYAAQFQQAILSRDKKSAYVEFSDIIADSLNSIRKLVRLIQKFDSVQLFYHGTASFYRSILPAAIIARFFGKEVALFYYPEQMVGDLPILHSRVMSVCRNVYVATDYFKRGLSKNGIASEVMLPPVNVKALPLRTITEVQPHILLAHESAVDSGAICAMRAFIMVKRKYPRTSMTVITSETIRWPMGVMQLGRNIEGHDYKKPDNLSGIASAFANADVFVNCSPSENAPSWLLAAMASGMPSISFETYGARAIIDSGVNGLLIRHNDYSQLADKIIKLIEEPELAEKLSKEAVKIRSRFNIENIIRNF